MPKAKQRGRKVQKRDRGPNTAASEQYIKPL